MSGPLDLDAIKARAEGATPGPWGLCDSSDARSKGYIRPCGPPLPDSPPGRPAICRMVRDGHDAATARANVAFIEHAREDVPALLAEVERLRELARAALRADHNEVQAMIDALKEIVGGEP